MTASNGHRPVKLRRAPVVALPSSEVIAAGVTDAVRPVVKAAPRSAVRDDLGERLAEVVAESMKPLAAALDGLSARLDRLEDRR